MQTVILGDGPMGQALAGALAARRDAVTVLGRPEVDDHRTDLLGAADVVFEFSRGDAVAGNVDQALAAGARRIVIGTSGWDDDRASVDRMLATANAAGVWGATFSIGVALFMRLAERAAGLFGRFEEYDPFVVEWHRAGKIDRPSGTAKELSRRLIAAHPGKRVEAEPGSGGARRHEERDVTSIRAGSAAPGMHLVGFDAPGETLEMRITARDRTAYAAGAIAAAQWLTCAPRPAGLHSFDTVIDDMTSIGESDR
jgi:4-hydroxy-tetrahydrodipicolinate reductase